MDRSKGRAEDDLGVNTSTDRNVLGKYAVPVTVGVVLVVITLALLQHFLNALGIVKTVDTFIDSIAMVAFGIVLGGAGSVALLNGTVKQAALATESVKTLAKVTPGVQLDPSGRVVET